MLRLILSPDATQDLDDIWDYIATNNQSAANKVIDEIATQFELLRQMPEAGRSRSELQMGLRSFPVGRYLIFYRPSATSVEIVRVLHSARDVDAMFGLNELVGK